MKKSITIEDLKNMLVSLEVKYSPCRFCGEENDISTYRMKKNFFVACGNCNATGPICNTSEEAEFAWDL